MRHESVSGHSVGAGTPDRSSRLVLRAVWVWRRSMSVLTLATTVLDWFFSSFNSFIDMIT